MDGGQAWVKQVWRLLFADSLHYAGPYDSVEVEESALKMHQASHLPAVRPCHQPTEKTEIDVNMQEMLGNPEPKKGAIIRDESGGFLDELVHLTGWELQTSQQKSIPQELG